MQDDAGALLARLARALSGPRGEDPLTEWKSFFPRRKVDAAVREDVAREAAAMANTAAYFGTPAAYLYLGVSPDLSWLGLAGDPEDQRIFADILRSRVSPPMSGCRLVWCPPELVRETFPDREVRGGMYCAEIPRAYLVPYRYREGNLKYGVIQLRHGSEVVEPDPAELRRLVEMIIEGPSALLDPHSRERLREAAEDADSISEYLKSEDYENASKRANRLMLAPDGPGLFREFENAPFLTIPLLRRVNPVGLLRTATWGNREFKYRIRPRGLRRGFDPLGIESEIKAWDGLRSCYREVLENGLSPEVLLDASDFGLDDLRRNLIRAAKSVLLGESKTQEGAWAYHWPARAFPLGMPMLPPKGWTPEERGVKVSGIVFLMRSRWNPLLGPVGTAVQLPILGQDQRRNLVWWGILLEPSTCVQLFYPGRPSMTSRTFEPWEREAMDLMDEGKLTREEITERMARAKGRLDSKPLWAGLVAMSLSFVIWYATSGNLLVLVPLAAIWAIALRTFWVARKKGLKILSRPPA